jgi:hypothetical protein
MGNSRKEYQQRIDTLFNIFIAMVSLGLALYALYVAKGNKPMMTLLSTWGCFVIALIAFVWAIFILIQMKKLPEETKKKELPDIKILSNQIDELKKLQTDLNDFFEHLPQHDTIQKK